MNEFISGSELEKEKVDRLVKYIRNIITSAKVPINTRLDAVFRLEEWKLISASEISELLDGLLKHRFRLYHLDPFPLHRCVEFLKKTSSDPANIDLLASGICTDDKVIADLSSWVLRRSDPEIISQFLLTAMTENLPPELESSKFSSLNSRLNACKALTRGLSISHGSWQDIYNAFGQMVKAFGKVTESEKIFFLLPQLVNLAWNLHLKVEKSNTFGEFEVIDKLIDPGLRMKYVLALLNSVKNAELPEIFYNQIEDRLISTADKRGDDILTPLLSSRSSNEIDESEALARLAEKVSSGGLIERAGKRLCEIAGQANESDLIKMIPHLDSFQRLPGTWSWSSTLEHVREKAFFELFSQPVEAVEIEYRQFAPLMYAASKVAEIKKEKAQEEVKAYQKQVIQLQEKVESLQNLLKEKESVMRELSSSGRGDTLKARFEERSKILKELVTSLAEFDRVTFTQHPRPREVAAMLRRFDSLIAAYKVYAQGEIGDQVPFNPQKHHLVEGDSLSSGEPVLIIEKGYLILDPSEKLRLLKPALVKNTNQF